MQVIQEIQEVIENLKELIGEYNNVVDVAILAVLLLVYRKVKRAVAALPTVAASEEKKSSEKEQRKAAKARKEQLKDEFAEAVELIYSGKSDSELTEEDKAKITKVYNFMKGDYNENV